MTTSPIIGCYSHWMLAVGPTGGRATAPGESRVIDERKPHPWRGLDGTWAVGAGGRRREVGLKEIAAAIRDLRNAGQVAEAERLRREVKWLCAWYAEAVGRLAACGNGRQRGAR